MKKNILAGLCGIFSFPCWVSVFLAIFLVSGISVTAGTILVNGSFESGSLSGWTVNAPLYETFPGSGVFDDLGSAQAVNDPAHAKDGNYYALIVNNNPALKDTGVEKLISLRQNVFVQSGETFSGYADFATTDAEFADSAWVRIWKVGGPGALFLLPFDPTTHYQDIPPFVPTNWEAWSWNATDTGVYTIEIGTSTGVDGEQSSYLWADGISHAKVPESTSGLAMLMASMGFLAMVKLSGGKRSSDNRFVA